MTRGNLCKYPDHEAGHRHGMRRQPRLLLQTMQVRETGRSTRQLPENSRRCSRREREKEKISTPRKQNKSRVNDADETEGVHSRTCFSYLRLVSAP